MIDLLTDAFMYKALLIFASSSDTSKIKTKEIFILCSDKSKNTTEGRFTYLKQKNALHILSGAFNGEISV